MFRSRSLTASKNDVSDLLSSRLCDQDSFYDQFLRDLRNCYGELIIESPFITATRVFSLLPVIKRLRQQSVKIVINTRHPVDHQEPYDFQAQEAVDQLLNMGVTVLYTGGHHRKIVVIDRHVLWEGSLNVLSQNDSCEVMRRIDSGMLAQQMIDFLNIKRFLV